MPQQVKSKQRVQDHGEVFTNEREVNAMLDMVKQETERIESRFLEPACGNGNFLAEVLRRKLAVVAQQYRRSPDDYMRYAFVAVSSLYGVDILEDNAQECRERLYGIVGKEAKRAIKKPDALFLESIRYVLDKNIVCGNALDLRTSEGEPIVFSEWSLVTGDKVKRRYFHLSALLDDQPKQKSNPSLFDERPVIPDLEFDEGTQSFIPKPFDEEPPINYWEVRRHG
ncbi:MAG: SAM-dependent DNA methyltransferase [Coriobacteriaceae bacterium]|nr:SAM-dependent DNA methyltransferase [Coriobacteriaceae bacterium]